MIRKLVLAGFASLAFTLAATPEAEAAPPISRNNPYAALNIIGINNASLQWERSHRQSPTRSRATHSVGWRLFRRR